MCATIPRHHHTASLSAYHFLSLSIGLLLSLLSVVFAHLHHLPPHCSRFQPTSIGHSVSSRRTYSRLARPPTATSSARGATSRSSSPASPAPARQRPPSGSSRFAIATLFYLSIFPPPSMEQILLVTAFPLSQHTIPPFSTALNLYYIVLPFYSSHHCVF